MNKSPKKIIIYLKGGLKVNIPETDVENQLDPKKINTSISNKARLWFFQNF